MASVSGSPKRVLNSRTMGPRGVIMMPQKRMPLKGSPSELHAVDCLLRDVAEEPLAHGGGGDAVGGVGAHAAGVGAGVAFADALVVLGGGDLDGVSAVAEGEEGELFAGEELFEDDFGLRSAEEGAAEHLGGGFFGLKVGLADDDAFAGGEAGGFDDDGHGEAGEFFADLVEGGADGVGGGGDVVALHELFGEGFAGLEHALRLAWGRRRGGRVW